MLSHFLVLQWIICISILHNGSTFTLNWVSIKRINQMSAVLQFIEFVFKEL